MPTSERDLELLSTYIDERLAPNERVALEARLASETDLRRELESLRATVRVIRLAERVRVPRSFTLDPKKYGRPARLSVWQRWGMSALTPMASAGAALAVLMIVGGGLLLTTGLSSPQAEMAASQPQLSGQAQGPQANFAPLTEAATEAPASSAADAAVAASPTPAPTAAAAAVGGGSGGVQPPSGGGYAPMPTQAVAVQSPVQSDNGQRFGSSPTPLTLTEQGGAESAATAKSGAGVPAEAQPAQGQPTGPPAAEPAVASPPFAALPIVPFVGGGLAVAGVALLIAIFARRRA